MTHRFFVAPVVLGGFLLSTGCATKSFVREEIGKTEANVGREVSRLDSDLGQEKTRVGSLAVLVTETRGVADEATRRAETASSKAAEADGTANQALSRAGATDSRLTRLWNSRNKLQPGDTILLLFGFDKWQLDDRAETSLLDVVKQLQENPNLMIHLEGYTDNVGDPPYNIGLSQRRVEAVRRFLVTKGIDLHRIQSIGLGDARPVANNKTRQGRDQNRRVAVTILTPAE